MIAFLVGLFFGGLVGFFVTALFVASAPTPNERIYKRGYEHGIRDFAERAKQNASWPERGEMHVEDIEDTLKEMLAEMEGDR
jgi:gas vesicle protein